MCSVCQSNYEVNDNVNKLPCDHCFHKDCVNEWLDRHNSCPICRKSIWTTKKNTNLNEFSILILKCSLYIY